MTKMRQKLNNIFKMSEADTVDLLCAFNDKYVKHLQAHCDDNVFGISDAIVEVDPIAMKSRKEFIVENMGITQGVTLGIVDLIKNDFSDPEEYPKGNNIHMQCSKFVQRFEIPANQHFCFPRLGDLVSAVYIPDYIDSHQYIIGEKKVSGKKK